MTSEDAPHTVYLILLLMLVISSVVGMRLPIAKVAKLGLAWIAIFGVAFMLFAFRDDFSAFGQKLRSEATGAPMEQGGELRIPMSSDGHFWVEAEINGHGARFLVDSGASITTVSSAVAEAAQLEIGLRSNRVETANGVVTMKRTRAELFEVGNIRRSDFAVNVNPYDGANVLGMNFLSSLLSWRVEGNYLVLRG